MKTHQRLSIRLSCLGLVLFAALSAAPAWANLAANTQIVNQAQLSYNSGTSTVMVTVSVTLTVALVATPPNIVPGPSQNATYAGDGTILTDSYTITAGANGPDTYNLFAVVSASTNTSGATATAALPTLSLGASLTTAGSTTTVLIVPADGNLPGEMPGVNGIQSGDTVVINHETRIVTAISDNPDETSSITLNRPLPAAPDIGLLVAEEQVVTVTVTAGTMAVVGSDVTVSVAMTATSVTSSGVTLTSGPVLNTLAIGVATLAKYVRNVSAPSGRGSPYIRNGVSYFSAGVVAKPGDVLEYLLIINNSGSGAVAASVVTDLLPSGSVALRTDTYGAGKEITYIDEINTATPLSAAVDADAATFDEALKTLTVGVGTGATNVGGGMIPGGNTNLLVLYQVILNR